MRLIDFKKDNGFQAFRAASYGIQQIIEKNFGSVSEPELISIKKFGIVSTEFINFKDKKILLVFSSLLSGANYFDAYVGEAIQDYNNEQKVYIVNSLKGFLRKEISVSVKEKSIKYKMPLEILILEVSETKKAGKTLINKLLEDSQLFRRLTNNKFKDFLQLIRHDLNENNIECVNQLDEDSVEIIKKLSL